MCNLMKGPGDYRNAYSEFMTVVYTLSSYSTLQAHVADRCFAVAKVARPLPPRRPASPDPDADAGGERSLGVQGI